MSKLGPTTEKATIKEELQRIKASRRSKEATKAATDDKEENDENCKDAEMDEMEAAAAKAAAPSPAAKPGREALRKLYTHASCASIWSIAS